MAAGPRDTPTACLTGGRKQPGMATFQPTSQRARTSHASTADQLLHPRWTRRKWA